MLSARTIYGAIFDRDEAFKVSCSIAGYERLGGQRRAVRLGMPARRSALGPPVPAQPSEA